MDFVVGLPLTGRRHDSVLVVVDRLTKSAHFLPVRTDYSLDKLAELYIKEIVRLHGILVSIISDRDPRFTSRFWGKLQEALGTRLNFSTAFHPQTDGQSERVIQILEDMLRSCVIDLEGSWDRHLALVEFVYNNSFQSSIGMAPYEALYERKCRTPLCWTELSEKKVIGPDLIRETEEKVKMIRERLKVATDRQKSYVDMKRKDIRYEIGQKVFLKVSPWKKVMRFGKKGKLSPRFIGPYEVIEKVGQVAYRLALPPDLEKIHDVFHVSMLRRYRSDPSHVVSSETIKLRPDLTYEEEPVEILAREVKELRNKKIPLVKVLWRNHKTEEATWESEETMRQQYLQLFDGYYIPNKEILINLAKRKNYYSKFDDKSGFWQIKMEKYSIPLIAFSIPKGHYEWLVMPFRLKNASQIFQRKMDKIFYEYSKFIIVYIDDVLIYSDNEKDHEKHLNTFITLCKKHGIVLS